VWLSQDSSVGLDNPWSSVIGSFTASIHDNTRLISVTLQ